VEDVSLPVRSARVLGLIGAVGLWQALTALSILGLEPATAQQGRARSAPFRGARDLLTMRGAEAAAASISATTSR